jgi:hypothetical protein
LAEEEVKMPSFKGLISGLAAFAEGASQTLPYALQRQEQVRAERTRQRERQEDIDRRKTEREEERTFQTDLYKKEKEDAFRDLVLGATTKERLTQLSQLDVAKQSPQIQSLIQTRLVGIETEMEEAFAQQKEMAEIKAKPQIAAAEIAARGATQLQRDKFAFQARQNSLTQAQHLSRGNTSKSKKDAADAYRELYNTEKDEATKASYLSRAESLEEESKKLRLNEDFFTSLKMVQEKPETIDAVLVDLQNKMKDNADIEPFYQMLNTFSSLIRMGNNAAYNDIMNISRNQMELMNTAATMKDLPLPSIEQQMGVVPGAVQFVNGVRQESGLPPLQRYGDGGVTDAGVPKINQNDSIANQVGGLRDLINDDLTTGPDGKPALKEEGGLETIISDIRQAIYHSGENVPLAFVDSAIKHSKLASIQGAKDYIMARVASPIAESAGPVLTPQSPPLGVKRDPVAGLQEQAVREEATQQGQIPFIPVARKTPGIRPIEEAPISIEQQARADASLLLLNARELVGPGATQLEVIDATNLPSEIKGTLRSKLKDYQRKNPGRGISNETIDKWVEDALIEKERRTSLPPPQPEMLKGLKGLGRTLGIGK